MIGTSANLHDVPAQHRMSSTMVDFTAERPVLARHGSVPVAQPRAALEQFGLGDLQMPAPRLVSPARAATA